jgi:PadR family transcriptional regulator PadR
MRRDGLVDYEWKESSAGPPRKYYMLTEAGGRHLDELNAYWLTIDRTVRKLGK